MKKVLVVDDQNGWRNFNSKTVYEILGNDIILDTASCAKEGYSKLLESKENPYDFLLTDMQMENDFYPLMAGEWLIEQAQNLSFCYKTKIIIISATANIRLIAGHYNVDCIPKSVAATSLEPFKELITPFC